MATDIPEELAASVFRQLPLRTEEESCSEKSGTIHQLKWGSIPHPTRLVSTSTMLWEQISQLPTSTPWGFLHKTYCYSFLDKTYPTAVISLKNKITSVLN